MGPAVWSVREADINPTRRRSGLWPHGSSDDLANVPGLALLNCDRDCLLGALLRRLLDASLSRHLRHPSSPSVARPVQSSEAPHTPPEPPNPQHQDPVPRPSQAPVAASSADPTSWADPSRRAPYDQLLLQMNLRIHRLTHKRFRPIVVRAETTARPSPGTPPTTPPPSSSQTIPARPSDFRQQGLRLLAKRRSSRCQVDFATRRPLLCFRLATWPFARAGRATAPPGGGPPPVRLADSAAQPFEPPRPAFMVHSPGTLR